jgi:multicomponent K+:H+ antiporter subunit D
LSNIIALPIVLPSLMAAVMVLAMRHDLVLQRIFGIASVSVVLAVAIYILTRAANGEVMVYELGAWPAPFGIVLAIDRLAAMMLLLTSVVALLVLVYASAGDDTRGRHFHALFQFQLMGLNGAFLTGDIFNLFVFFEVLLIASYGLMLHGVGPRRLRAGTHYVVVNLVGSTLFLFAVAFIYGVTGTLNMADLAVKVADVPAGDQAILQLGALLLLVVFGVKAALVPLHFWLPATYASTSPPVAALFAIMTKVGAYAIIRVYISIFGAGAGDAAWVAAPWLLPAALVTLVLGMVGVLAARSLRWMICFSVIGSMGMLFVAIGIFDPVATAAGLYYLLHSTLIAAALFLLVDQIALRRGQTDDRLELAPVPAQGDLLAGLFFIGAIAFCGLPPLSGFIGKLLILDAVQLDPRWPWIWALVLATSLLAITAFSRAGSLVFWKSRTVAVEDPKDAEAEPPSGPAPARPVPLSVVALFLLGTVLLTAFAAPIGRYVDATAAQLHDPVDYIEAVLGVATLAPTEEVAE